MENDDKRVRKNRKISKDTESDRSRIKNITNKVHPEYEVPKKRPARRTEEDEEMARKRAEARRKKQHQERRRKIIRRRKQKQALRLVAACLVIAALVVTVFSVKNYNSGSRHDNKGMNAYESGDYDTAVNEFKEAISYDGSNADYYIHLGMAYVEQKSYDEALGYFNQAEGCAENDDQKALLNRGRGIACLYQGDYQTAIKWFGDALNISSQSNDIRIDTLYYKAEAEQKSGDYQAAVQSYGQVIDLKDDAGTRMLRGMAYMQLQDYASAEKDLYAAIKQSRKSYAVYRTLYSALEAQGKDDEAKQVLNDALQLSGSSGEDYYNRGMIYVDLQDYTNAADMLNKSYDKGYKAALLGLGEASYTQQDYDTALTYYGKYFDEVDISSVDASLAAKAYNQYAAVLLAKGEYEKAAQACESGLTYNDRESDAALSFNLIVSYEHLEQWEDAYNTAKTYVSKYPEDTKGQKEYQFLESRVTQ
ncbi:tetratricopeptide repeat protein [Coprococcus sp. B2-R-112]|uniref:tetratricopeptide repeat protein n=1 Tax=Coprococcus sp. B2-R-112 TaxID=2949662 RepID=UPI0020305755|nr:tetratricopeptide repeat protein [Coprococcus sp. B2-R-112]MCM0661822.1 tetratricopeptide repeat protein [Coprococcus sp. B2-R-112]